MHAINKFKPTLDEETREYARTLLLALQPFDDLSPRMPLSYVMAFLQVAVQEGQQVGDYAQKRGISATVMTRNLLDIGDLNRQREPGLGIVTTERDLFDLRKHNTKVTPKGAGLMAKVVNALKTIPKLRGG
jgi:DNA-binding MarR family transcriptional regulator